MLKEILKDGTQLPPLLLLHGFLGFSQDWDQLISFLPEGIQTITPDLPGFGDNIPDPALQHYSLAGYMDYVRGCLKETKQRPVLCGYSMGGRVALGLCRTHPELFSGVIIISSGAGLQDEEERKKRLDIDYRLIQLVEKMQPENFLAFWYNQELFSTLPLFTNMKHFLTVRKKKYNPQGIIASLTYFGQGVMPFLGTSGEQCPLPALLIAGEKDVKYVQAMKDLLPLFRQAEYREIDGVSHALHLEKPQELATLVVSFLKSL